MKYKIYGDTIVLRVDPGEEILTCIEEVAQKEKIKLASISGLGAVHSISGGVFNKETGTYLSHIFEGFYELTNLVGNITTRQTVPHIHLHGTWSDASCETFGGHILSAVVSITAEIFITQSQGEIKRKLNQELGFQQMFFDIVP